MKPALAGPTSRSPLSGA